MRRTMLAYDRDRRRAALPEQYPHAGVHESARARIPRSTHPRQHQIRHRRVLAREHQAFLRELNAHAALGRRLNDMAKVVQISGEPVHAMHDYCVVVAHEGQWCVELRLFRVFPRCLVGKGPVKLDPVELTLGILLERADPRIADALTVHNEIRTSDRRIKSLLLHLLN